MSIKLNNLLLWRLYQLCLRVLRYISGYKHYSDYERWLHAARLAVPTCSSTDEVEHSVVRYRLMLPRENVLVSISKPRHLTLTFGLQSLAAKLGT